MTASFGKTLADDLNKYTSLEEKLEKAVEKIKKEAARVIKDNSNQIKNPSDRKNKKTRTSGRNDASYKNQNNTDEKKENSGIIQNNLIKNYQILMMDMLLKMWLKKIYIWYNFIRGRRLVKVEV